MGSLGREAEAAVDGVLSVSGQINSSAASGLSVWGGLTL